MAGRHRAVSTAEKKAEYARRGEPWPTYPVDGTLQQWKVDANSPEGGYFKGHALVQVQREADRRRHRAQRATPGLTCNVAGCGKPRRQHNGGAYHPLCAEHGVENDRWRRGWFDEGGMATDAEFAAVTESIGSINSRTKETA